MRLSELGKAAHINVTHNKSVFGDFKGFYISYLPCSECGFREFQHTVNWYLAETEWKILSLLLTVFTVICYNMTLAKIGRRHLLSSMQSKLIFMLVKCLVLEISLNQQIAPMFCLKFLATLHSLLACQKKLA